MTDIGTDGGEDAPKTRKMHAPIRGWLFLGLTFAVIGFWIYFALYGQEEGMNIQALLADVQAVGTHPLAPFATVPLFVAGSFLVAPIYGMIAVCALVFGPWTATASALVSTMVASAVTHWMGVHFGQVFSHHIPDSVTTRINRVAGSADAWSIAGLQCLPIAPFTILNMLVGAAGVRMRTFLAGTFITMVPTVVLITLSVDRARAILAGESAFDPWIVAAITAAGIALIVLRAWQKRGRL
jgi:uncharacterized membrane protein YdjX (TVP38/TMEM64 family)